MGLGVKKTYLQNYSTVMELFKFRIGGFSSRYNPEFAIAAYPVIGINLLGSLLFIFLGLGRHRALLRMPGAFLMGITALLAWLGI